MDFDGDSPFVAMQLRDIYDHGWYWQNPDLGYPFGQSGYLFPELNVLHVAIVKGLGIFASDPYTPGVVYFVLGFPLAGLTSFLLARSQGIGHLAALVVGVLFASAPGHQENFGHLWLASYWTIPLGLWVVLEIAGNRPLLRRRPRSGPTTWLTVRTGLVALALTLVGLSGVYYVAFTLILLAVVTVGRRWAGGSPRDWLPGLGAGAFLVAVIGAPLMIVKVAGSSETLTGPPPTARSLGQSELFAGKLMDLLLPWQGHRLEPLAFLTFVYNAGNRSTAEVAAIGIVAVLGVAGLAATSLRMLLVGLPSSPRVRVWAALAAVSFGFYTVGALGSFTALFITPQIRTWSRLAVFILLLGLLAASHWLTKLAQKRTRLGALIPVLTLVVGVLDQTNPARAPKYEETASSFAAVSTYTRELEARTAPDCAIFQLPVVAFPESAGAGNMNGYDQLIPYLTSRDLRWSSGAMRGTPAADWQLAMDPRDTKRFGDELAALGFCAVEVDVQAFDARTDPRGPLGREFGAPIAKSVDGVYVAYRLPRSSATTQIGSPQATRPLVVFLEAYDVRITKDGPRQWVGPRAIIRVVNLQRRSVPIRIEMTARSETSSRTLTVCDLSGRPLLESPLEPSVDRPLVIEMNVPPGVTRLPVAFTGDPVRLRDQRILVAGEISDLIVSSHMDGVQASTEQQQVFSGAAIVR